MSALRPRPRSALAALILAVAAALPAAAQDWGDEPACAGLLEQPERLAAVLAGVEKYLRTYVLVLPEALAGTVTALDAPQLAAVAVAAQADSPAAALVHGLAGADLRPYDHTRPAALAAAVLDGSLGAAALWAPLAGLAVQELDFDYQLSLRTVGAPSPAPPFLAAAPTPAALDDTETACAQEVTGTLEGYGVVPAEKLVQLDIRDLLHLRPPAPDLAAARAAEPLYAEHCAKCHGVQAVAARDQLAPVDLLVSLPRFSYPGFLYIVLNGRSQNGMPGFNGSLSREQVDDIYRYLGERARGTVPSTGGEPPATAQPETP